MQIKRKLKSRAGFTLAETMLAVLILLLVSGIVAAGIPAAKNAYLKVIVGANAQALASTTANALRDELGTAWDVKKEEDGSISYFSANTGARSKLYKSATDGTIMLQEYVGMGSLIQGGSLTGDSVFSRLVERPLVTETAKTSDLYVTYDTVTVNKDNTVTFGNLEAGKVENGSSTPLIKLSSVTIPVFSATAPSGNTTIEDQPLGD